MKIQADLHVSHASMTDAELRILLGLYQDVQKRNPTVSQAWRGASVMIHDICAQMAERHPAVEGAKA